MVAIKGFLVVHEAVEIRYILYALDLKVEVDVEVTYCQGTPSSRTTTSVRQHLDFQRVCRCCRSKEGFCMI